VDLDLDRRDRHHRPDLDLQVVNRLRPWQIVLLAVILGAAWYCVYVLLLT
jgi:hypothetical protein